MRKYFSIIAVIAIAAISASCQTKQDLTPDFFLEQQQETAKVFDVDLRFDAPATLKEATVYFFDEHGQQVAVDNLSIPATSAEAVTTAFLSETRPAYLLTEGLQNVGENGLLAIPNSAVSTRAGGSEPLLLVIR